MTDDPTRTDATLRYELATSNAGSVNLATIGGSIYAGMSGAVEALPLAAID